MPRQTFFFSSYAYSHDKQAHEANTKKEEISPSTTLSTIRYMQVNCGQED